MDAAERPCLGAPACLRIGQAEAGHQARQQVGLLPNLHQHWMCDRRLVGRHPRLHLGGSLLEAGDTVRGPGNRWRMQGAALPK